MSKKVKNKKGPGGRAPKYLKDMNPTHIDYENKRVERILERLRKK